MRAYRQITIYCCKASLLLLLLVATSCATYNSQIAVESDLYNGNFDKVAKDMDSNSFLKKDKNRLLYLMEKGKVEHLRGNYEASNNLLEQAYIMVDDKIKTSTGQYVVAKFTNPNAEPYKGEDFEKVIIHYYKALNYFMLGRPAEALVEAKRINIKLYELNEKYTANKNKYSEDAFSQVLQGIIYESTGDVNNAFIAYRNAEEIYTKNGNEYFGVKFPQQLKDDLLRTSFALSFREEFEGYKKKFGMPKDFKPNPPALGEAIIFWENGLGPAKDQLILTASGKYGAFVGTYTDEGQTREFLLPIPPGVDIGIINAIAIPKYRKRDSFYANAVLEAGSREIPVETVEDFYPIARQCLQDRMLREVVDIVARFAVKKGTSAGLGAIAENNLKGDWGDLIRAAGDIAGAATERADTRNWQTLPNTIGYARVPLTQGENKITIKKYGPQGVVDTDTIIIPFRRGLQIVNYYDLGRTQVTPQATAAYVAPAVKPADNLSNNKL